jgi:catechol 2,3-dioxygenase-like lactoylglutathione lyase family enzyme
MLTSVNHTSFTVGGIARSAAFYRDVLGMKLELETETSGEYIQTVTGFPDAHIKVGLLSLGDHRLELIQYVAPKGTKLDTRTCNVGSPHLAFWCDDIQKTYQELKAKGVAFKSAPMVSTVSGNWACYFTDPDGIALELNQRGS